MAIKLKYETGIATTAQLIVVTVFNIINGTASSIDQCTNNSGNCVSNIVLSLLYFMVLSVGFVALWLIGMAAQDKRSKRLAQLLILGEFVVAGISIFDLTHQDPSITGRISSFVDGVFSVWIIILAIRLLRAKGGRVRKYRKPVKKDEAN